MSEGGVGPREVWEEQQFGHVVLQTYLGEVYSLDLYVTYATPDTNAPGIVCRGYYLSPTGEFADRLLRRWERIGFQTVPRSVPVEVELFADQYAFNALGDMVFGGEYPGRYEPNTESPLSGNYFLRGPESHDFHEMYAQVSLPIRRRERTTWAGMIGGKGTKAGGEFSFVLDQYGTIEPLLLLVFLFFASFFPEDTAQATARCYQQALVQCGEGNVKLVNATRGINGAVFSVSGGCQIECFERWHPSS